MSTSTTTNRRARRRGRLRNTIARRLEILEDRTLLNASIDIDADGLLTYKTDGAIAETLNISVAGDVYTFASDVDIDVLTNIPDLVVTGDGTTTVTVAAISGLAVDVDFDFDEINVLSSNVDTAINWNASWGFVRLGNYADAAGLGALAAPITIVGSGQAMARELIVNDYGSSLDTTYTLTPTTLTAANGFGGLTYSGVKGLNLQSSTASNEYNIKGTADGVATTLMVTNPGPSSNTFIVEGTSSDANSGLQILGDAYGGGSNVFNIEAASSPVRIDPGTASSIVNLGNSEGVAGINSLVDIRNYTGGSVDIVIDNPTGSDSGAWDLTGGYAAARLTGFGPGGVLQYTPRGINSLTVGGAGGSLGRLRVDFSDENPLPSATGVGRLFVKGESGPGGGLSLTGGWFISETHDALSPSSGRITLEVGEWKSIIDYDFDDAFSWDVHDLVPTAYYTFNNRTALESPFVITKGAEVDGGPDGKFQTLLLSPTGAYEGRGLNVGLKRNVTVNADPAALGVSVTVDGLGETPVRALETLEIVTNGGDGTVDFANMPPGILSVLRQGGGDDQAIVSVAGLGRTHGVILDGGPGDNTLTIDAGGAPLTPSRFRTHPGGSTGVVLSDLLGPLTYSNYQHVLVTNASLSPLYVRAERISAVRGRRLVDVVAGIFRTDSPEAEAGDFTATINWGDGSSSAALIVPDFWDPSLFYVKGTHVYHENADSLTTTITVNASPSAYTHTRIINGASVTFELSGAGGAVSAQGSAAVGAAVLELAVESFEEVENVASTAVVATFTDLGVNAAAPDPTARYAVTVDWGDGSGPTTVPDGGIVYDRATKVYTVTTSRPAYSRPGTYEVTVTVVERPPDGFPGAVLATATSVAHIVDAPLTAVSPQTAIPDVIEDAPVVDQILGAFADANPLALIGEFTAMIDWGDGSQLSPGSVIQPGGLGAPFLVVGSHAYASARPATDPPTGQTPAPGPVTADGIYPIRIFIQSVHGSTAELSNTITVLDREMVVTGQLDPASDSGVSNSDAVTNVRRPDFFGAAGEPGALVFLYATPFGGTAVLIGQATADANGTWSITSNVALADGGYVIQAQAYDASGNSISELAAIAPNLIIDTVGPRIKGANLAYLGGRAIVVFEDYGGASNGGTGLAHSTLVDANNYQLSMLRPPLRGLRGVPRWRVTAASVRPGASVAPQAAMIWSNNGRPIRLGRFAVNVAPAAPTNPAGVQDIAGNALEGRLEWRFTPANRVPIRPVWFPRHPGGPMALRLATMRGLARG